MDLKTLDHDDLFLLVGPGMKDKMLKPAHVPKIAAAICTCDTCLSLQENSRNKRFRHAREDSARARCSTA